MSVGFMVLGGPRSGTTWAANWLTTDRTICLHDPLVEYTLERLQRITFPGGQTMGISCTSSMLYPDWVNSQPCPKVVLHRPVEEINRSLRELGLVELIPAKHEARLAAVRGAFHVPYEHLFTPTGAMVIAKHLRVPFDAARHFYLTQMRVEPMWKHLAVGRDAILQLSQRIMEAR